MNGRCFSVPKWLFVLILAFVLAVAPGCSAPRSPYFRPMPAPGQWGRQNYTTILGPVTGIGSKSFTISARPGIAAWLGCVGKGLVWIKSPVAFAAKCGDRGAFAGGQRQLTHIMRGQELSVRVVGPAGARWELRIDAKPWPHT